MCVAAFAFLIGCDAVESTPTTLVLSGDVSAVYSNGKFVVFDPQKRDSATSAVGMSTSAAVAPAASASNATTSAGAIGMTAATPASEASTATPAAAVGMTAATPAGEASTAIPAAAVGMTAATPASEASNDDESKPHPNDALYESLNIVAEAEIMEDGTFSLSTSVEEPLPVYFYVLYATSESGNSLAPVKGQHFILEPGNLTFSMNERGRFVIDGGYYNDEVFNSWKTSPEYIDANAQYAQLLNSVDGETEEERRKRVDASSDAMSRILDLETEGRKHIVTTHPDSLVRRLTLQTTWLTGPWYGSAISDLAVDMPDDIWVQEALVRHEAAEVRRAQQAHFSEGNQIQDFEAYTLDGTNIKFSDVRGQSKLILLEFWASWCGPCIAEIPHMKQAYERFKPYGFEIVSFTIDDTRENWELASGEQDIPWIDLGMGPEAPAAVAYGVTGVPKNFLVDAETGVIIATDLRQHKLDEKLEEELL